MSVDVPIRKYPLGDITQRLHENKMRWHVSYIGVGYGKPKWGAPYHPVFIIGLGNRYKRDFKTPRPLPSFCITEK